MTQPTITKIKNGKIVLPENLQKNSKTFREWLGKLWKKLKRGGKKISPQLIGEAVKWAKSHL